MKKTHLRDGEVDERGLRLDLRRVVRVGHLGMQKQLEVFVVLNILVAHLDVHRAALLAGGARHYGRVHRVDLLAHVLH
jgi:hypothetical protein